MKNTGFIIICCIFAIILIPLINIKFVQFENTNDIIISVYNTVEERVQRMNIEDYVLKVLEKEMPPTFNIEALKAQAVAIRTYALRKINSADERHHGADLCTDYEHCMAYAFDEYEMWKENTEKYKEIYNKAVSSTSGMILKYNNEPAATFFFSMSNGKTQNCKDVWGSDLPYLVSVDSSEDINQTNFKSVFTISSDDILKQTGLNMDNGYEIKRYDNGYVDHIVAGGVSVSGKDIREKLSLRSSCFDFKKILDGYYEITVYGNGHGVGMSQYGADSMGKEGKNYKEILNHYYSGTILTYM